MLATFVVLSDLTGDDDSDVRVVDDDEHLAAVQDTVQQLKAHLAACVPHYMMPRRWVPLTRLPLSSSGKTDRRALVALLEAVPAATLAQFMGADAVKQPPQTDNERVLHAVWCELFKLPSESVGRLDSFLHLGGDSVLSIALADACRRRGYSVSVADISRLPVLCALAGTLHAIDAGEADDHVEPFSLLQSAGVEREMVLRTCAGSFDLAADDVEDAYPVSHLQEGCVLSCPLSFFNILLTVPFSIAA